MSSPLTFATGFFNSTDGAAVSEADAAFVPDAEAAAEAAGAGVAAAGVAVGAGVEGAAAGVGAGLQAGSNASAAAATGDMMAAERWIFVIGIRDTECAGMFIKCQCKKHSNPSRTAFGSRERRLTVHGILMISLKRRVFFRVQMNH